MYVAFPNAEKVYAGQVAQLLNDYSIVSFILLDVSNDEVIACIFACMLLH